MVKETIEKQMKMIIRRELHLSANYHFHLFSLP